MLSLTRPAGKRPDLLPEFLDSYLLGLDHFCGQFKKCGLLLGPIRFSQTFPGISEAILRLPQLPAAALRRRALRAPEPRGDFGRRLGRGVLVCVPFAEEYVGFSLVGVKGEEYVGCSLVGFKGEEYVGFPLLVLKWEEYVGFSLVGFN